MNVELQDGELILTDSYMYKDFIKSRLFDPKWKKEQKAWIIPCNMDNIIRLEQIGILVPKEAEEYGRNLLKGIIDAKKEKMVDQSIPVEPMPIKAKPYQHQIKGFNIACKLMNLFKKE